MEVVSGMIIGLDTDTPDTGRFLQKFVEQSQIPLLTMNLLQALPRTPLWDRLKREGRLIEDDDSRESNVVFQMPYDEVVAMWRECMRVGYQPEALFGRYEHQIRVAYANRLPLPNSPQRASWRNIKRGLIMLVAHLLVRRHQGRLQAGVLAVRPGAAAARRDRVLPPGDAARAPSDSVCPRGFGGAPQRLELQRQADRRRNRWSPPNRRRYQVPDAPKARGGGLTIWPPDGLTRITASPRSLVPSLRKRNSPSIPANPDGLVSTWSENRCGPCVFTSAATSATAS